MQCCSHEHESLNCIVRVKACLSCRSKNVIARRPLCPKETRPFTWGIRSASAGLPHSTPHLVPSRDNYEKSRETGHRSRRDSQLRGGSLDLVQMTRNSNSVCASTIAARPNFLPTGFVQPVRRVGSASPHLCRPSGTPVCESVRYRLNNISRSRDPSPLSLKTSKSPLPRSRSCSEDRAVYGEFYEGHVNLPRIVKARSFHEMGRRDRALRLV